MRAATEGSLLPVMPRGNLVEVLGREVRQGLPGELMVEGSPSRQRRPPCKTKTEMSDEAADAAALTYLLTSPALLASVISMISPLGRGTPRELEEAIFFFNSWKHSFSLADHLQGVGFSIRSVRGAEV